ncbi:MAG: endonuclease III [Candidatus Altimarinota bacterium]
MKNLGEIIQRLDELFPNPKTELEFKNEFQLLIAIIMSAQTTDKQVNKVNEIFFTKFSTPEELFKLGEEEIKKNINKIGLYNSKAKNIFLTSKMLLEEYNQKIPENLIELQKLPGVGVKTAKVWLSVVKNESYLAVDTHVHRVLNRLGIVKTKSPGETDKVAEKKLKKEDLARLHHTLILFGRYYCTAKNPKCSNCALLDVCPYKEKNL